MEQSPDSINSYLATVTHRLRTWGFTLRENISYKDGLFRYVVRKTVWESNKGGFLETFFVFAYVGSVLFRWMSLNIHAILSSQKGVFYD